MPKFEGASSDAGAFFFDAGVIDLLSVALPLVPPAANGAGFVRAAFIVVVAALILKTGRDAFG